MQLIILFWKGVHYWILYITDIMEIFVTVQGLSWSYSSNCIYKLPMQSVPITTKVVSSNLSNGEAYSIQHYVIKFVSDLWQVGEFRQVLRFPPPIKLTAMI
jgi:hypothetical protein